MNQEKYKQLLERFLAGDIRPSLLHSGRQFGKRSTYVLLTIDRFAQSLARDNDGR